MKKILYETASKLVGAIKKLNIKSDVHVYQELFPTDSVVNRRFYNVGAGDFYHPCWTNIDKQIDEFDTKNQRKMKGINQDFLNCEPFPVESNSAEVVYCSHTLEHLNNESVINILKESFRILKPGGIIRIITPDIDLAYNAWQRGDRKFFYWIHEDFVNENLDKICLNTPLSKASTAQIFLEEFAASASEIATVGADTRISDDELIRLFKEKKYEDALDYCISFCSVEVQREYPFRHMNWFNENKFKSLLSKVGFGSVFKSGYLQSTCAPLRNASYFDQTVPRISIFMEAVK